MATKRLIKIGQLTALISFLLGTAIFGLYFQTSYFKLLFVGYGYIFLAGLINLIVFATILIQAGKDNKNRIKLLRTSWLMLSNIPIMIAYCWITMILIETMRITFTNDTGTRITDINIIGCGGEHIEKLKTGESKTVWVDITGDCSIYIDYLSNGQRKKERVAGYVTSNMGQKINHKIDGKDKDVF